MSTQRRDRGPKQVTMRLMLLEHKEILPQVLDPTSGDCGDEDTDDDDDEGAP